MLAVAPSVQADPIQITSGSITITGVNGTPHYNNLIGQNFSFNAAGGDTSFVVFVAPVIRLPN